MHSFIYGVVTGLALLATWTWAAPSLFPLQMVIYNPLALAFNPASPSVACNAAAGTLVSTGTFSGGDGNPITPTLTGDTTDFALGTLSGSSLPIIVGPNAISPSHCPVAPALTTTETLNVNAVQN